MPKKPLKPCSYPGCGNLVESGYCSVHARNRTGNFKRDPKVQKLYDRAWRKRRAAHLAKHPWCADCLDKGLFTPAVDVHHVDRHQGDKRKFKNSDLKSLCKVCHSRRTVEELKQAREGGLKVSS